MNSNLSNLTSTTNESCADLDFYHDSILQLESYLLVFLSLIALLANSLFIHVLRRSTGQTGSDVRALLLSSLISCQIRTVYLLIRGIYVLLLIHLTFERLRIHWLLCSFLELPYGVATTATILCMLAIGMNRFHVTRPIDHRGSSSNSLQTTTTTTTTSAVVGSSSKKRRLSSDIDGITWKTKTAIALIWLIALVFYACLMFGMNDESRRQLSNGYVCFCYYPMILKPRYSYASNAWFFALELSVLVIFIVVLVRNRNMLMQFTLRTRQYSLRQRCRAWMNVRTTKMLLPPAIVHGSIVLMVVACVSPIRDAMEADPSTRVYRLVVLIQLGICLDVIAYPLLCIRFNECFRKAVKDLLIDSIDKLGGHTEVEDGGKKEIEGENNCEDPPLDDSSRKSELDRKMRPIDEEASTIDLDGPSSLKCAYDLDRAATYRNRLDLERSAGARRARSASIPANSADATSSLLGAAGKKNIVDYRLAPEVHDQIVQRTWEMKPRKAK